MLGAYQKVQDFAYPGWRLTVPGGPAGGHYKGFTHNLAAGTAMDPQDQYEWDRASGASSHDAVHASPKNPRGVYRSSGEVPPRPNASGNAMTYRGMQTKRHAGTSISPGSFPANFDDTPEDSFLHGVFLEGEPEFLGEDLGLMPYVNGGPRGGPNFPCPHPNYILAGQHWVPNPSGCGGHWAVNITPAAPPNIPTTGATSVVAQPMPTPVPLAPSPSIPVAVVPPVSPTPAPIVATNEVVPSADGTGYVNLSTGVVVPASQVMQNPATGQLVAQASGALTSIETWMTQPSSFFPSIPNWGLLAGAAAALMLLHSSGGAKRR